MLLRRAAFALLLSLSAFAPCASADTRTLDFEAPSTALPSYPGITFLATAPGSDGHWFGGGVAFVQGFRPSYPEFGAGAFGNYSGSPGYSDLGFHLDAPVQSVGAWVFGCPLYFCGATPAAIEMIGRNAAGEVVADQWVAMPADPSFLTAPVWAQIQAADISQVEWRVGGDVTHAGHFVVDNVVLTAVPEPASAVLAGVGIALLGAWRRKRHAPA